MRAVLSNIKDIIKPAKTAKESRILKCLPYSFFSFLNLYSFLSHYLFLLLYISPFQLHDYIHNSASYS